MRNIIIGFCIGISLSLSIAVAASGEPRIVGGSGHLTGVEVTIGDGKIVCDDPYYHESSNIISCQ